METQQSETVTDREIDLFQPFVTNVDRPIFCLRNLPDGVKGTLFARDSRRSTSLRRLLLDEVVNEPESGFAAIVSVHVHHPAAQPIAPRQAEAFYDRVLIGHGDDSVADLGGAHLACEGVSTIAAKLLEDSRLGSSPIQQSTRSVRGDRTGANGCPSLRERAIMASPLADRYVAVMDHRFTTYGDLLEPVQAWLQRQYPRDEATTPRAYRTTIQATALDLLRGLLPMATQTTVGLVGNGRTFAYLIIKPAASPFAEAQALRKLIQAESDQGMPSFVKRARSERGQAYADYLATTREQVAVLARQIPVGAGSTTPVTVTTVDDDRHAEWKLAAAILSPHLDLPLSAIEKPVAAIPEADRHALITAAVGNRANRVHRPGRAFEEPYSTFATLSGIGADRDLHRHRVLPQERQRFTVRHGSITPPEPEEIDVADLVTAREGTLSNEAQDAGPCAFRVRRRMQLTLRDASPLIELRSARQGHPGYRQIAQRMGREIGTVHPFLAAGMRFVDHHAYDLERLAAEQRLDHRRQQVGQWLQDGRRHPNGLHLPPLRAPHRGRRRALGCPARAVRLIVTHERTFEWMQEN